MKNDVLVTINGVPAITKSDLEKAKEYWAKDPQLQDGEDNEYINSPAFEKNCLNGLIRRAIAKEYVFAHKINETAEYQERLKHAVDTVHKEILWETINVLVSEEELQALYEKWSSDSCYEELVSGKSYEESREVLERYLKKVKFHSYLDEKLEQLKQEFDVKINEDFLK